MTEVRGIPEHVRCENCVFFSEVRRGQGQCKRGTPSAPAPITVIHALSQIYWTITKGHTEYGSKESAIEFDPDFSGPDEADRFPYTDLGEWCGEFRSEWPEAIR